ncbi:hypothetical protein AB205_0112010, partial [Aquarana catesbeiana]
TLTVFACSNKFFACSQVLVPNRTEQGGVRLIPKQEEEEEGDVVEIVTTTGDRDVVDPGHFTSESAQILIGEIMECNRDLENIQKNINDVKKNEEHN